ncbi:MAG: HEAT repeat domain-containing protein [Planctomycetes bacterium]|nr:HEAT repeat domain-containing protein [Planctomycetota bacterium]
MNGYLRRHDAKRAVLVFGAVFLVGLADNAIAQHAKVRWTTSFEAARAAAEERKVPIFVAVHHHAERCGVRFVAEHYRDAGIAKLLAQTVPVFCSRAERSQLAGVSADQQQACHREVRKNVFSEAEDGWIRSQHVALAPDGSVLGAVAGYVTKGELEWFLVWALRKVRPAFEWKLSDAARAPATLRFGGTPYVGGSADEPPTPTEIDDALSQIAKGGRAAWANARELIPKLVFSDDARALAFGKTALTFGRGRGGNGRGGNGGGANAGAERRVAMIDQIAKRSPIAWSRVVVVALDDPEEAVRKAAAIALGELGDASVTSDLAKRLRDKDETPGVKSMILRAQAMLDPRQTSLNRSLEKILATSKSEDERLQAVVAAATLENRKAVTNLLGRALADASPSVRQGAAYMVARRRDSVLRDNVTFVRDGERDAATKDMLSAALKALEDGPLEPFRAVHERIGYLDR